LNEVNDFTQPNAAAIESVISFLKTFDVFNFEYSSGFLRATVSVEKAEKMLETKYNLFTHATSGVKAIRCLSYSLPQEVADAIDFVAPTVNFPPSLLRVKTDANEPLTISNTPNSLRTLYGVGSTTGHRNLNSRQAVTAFLNQYYEEKDLQNFYKSYYTPLVGTSIYNVIGPNGVKGGFYLFIFFIIYFL
jgi:tripeptidyl-peptidase-1